jgi:hypothetical protein
VPSERKELLEALLVEAPKLSFMPQGDPDPRLVRLVEFLARQAAREFYAESQEAGLARLLIAVGDAH